MTEQEKLAKLIRETLETILTVIGALVIVAILAAAFVVLI